PMIRHQDGVMVGNQGFESIGQLRRAWSAVTGQWDRSQTDDDLAHQGPVQIVSGSGKPGGSGRVRVDDAIYVGAQAINQQVHAELGGNAAPTGEASSVHVDNHHVGSAHPALAYGGGSYQQA